MRLLREQYEELKKELLLRSRTLAWIKIFGPIPRNSTAIFELFKTS